MDLTDLKIAEKIHRLGLFVPTITVKYEEDSDEGDKIHIQFKNNCLNDIIEYHYWDEFTDIVDMCCKKYDCKLFMGIDIHDEHKAIVKITTNADKYENIVRCLYMIIRKSVRKFTSEGNFSADLLGYSIMLSSPATTLLCGLEKNSSQREYTRLYLEHCLFGINECLPDDLKCLAINDIEINKSGLIMIGLGDLFNEGLTPSLGDINDKCLEDFAESTINNVLGLLDDVVVDLATIALPEYEDFFKGGYIND
ncbi:MAG: hypothetical protein ACI4VQ_00065 [Clostridia bacterium]